MVTPTPPGSSRTVDPCHPSHPVPHAALRGAGALQSGVQPGTGTVGRLSARAILGMWAGRRALRRRAASHSACGSTATGIVGRSSAGGCGRRQGRRVLVMTLSLQFDVRTVNRARDDRALAVRQSADGCVGFLTACGRFLWWVRPRTVPDVRSSCAVAPPDVRTALARHLQDSGS